MISDWLQLLAASPPAAGCRALWKYCP